MSYRFVDSFQAKARKCVQTCVTYTIAECTVNKLLMMDRGTVRNMCRVSCQNKFVKLVHLVGFITNKVLPCYYSARVESYTSEQNKQLFHLLTGISHVGLQGV